MKLTVIGCSPAWPNPGGAHSGYLVESDGKLLLDCGPGVLSRLRSHGLLAVDAIAITHFHLDHWGDLVPWAWLSAYGERPPARPALWLPPGGRDELAAFASRWGQPGMFDTAFEPAEYEPGRPFEAAGFEVEARAVEHYGIAAYGFRVRDHTGRLLAYSGDSGPGDGLRDLAAGADLFVCEATLATGAKERGSAATCPPRKRYPSGTAASSSRTARPSSRRPRASSARPTASSSRSRP